MSGRDHNLPDFIGVGPPRTATTWLHEALTGHVFLPRGVKETQFFSWNSSRGLAWYQAHFRDCPPGRQIGEIGAAYFDRPEARERIARYIPDCKIICTLRDPVKRLYSNYRQLRCEGWIGALALHEAMAQHRQWSGPGNMFGASTYSPHLRAWREKFGKEKVLVLLNDDLEADAQSYLDLVSAFIGIPRIDLRQSPPLGAEVNSMKRAPKSPLLAKAARKLRELLRRHRLYLLSERCAAFWDFCFEGGEKFPPLDPVAESNLRAHFRREVEALEEMLERDLSAWKECPKGQVGRKATEYRTADTR